MQEDGEEDDGEFGNILEDEDEGEPTYWIVRRSD